MLICHSDPLPIAASWDASSQSGGVPQLKGARCFSFEEMKKCTNNFSESNNIGSGGYGKVQFFVILVVVKTFDYIYMTGCIVFRCIEGFFPVDNWLPLKELSKGRRRVVWSSKQRSSCSQGFITKMLSV